ncbi:acyl-CoA dehydrogenase family protein [Nesterenkonia sp.]|uniref:acyl-CoA dehydrogenase family protein n=1 Tax=Nesterenkonia sp. TaxID=704201 RepID=UPI002617917C|nr:acyl-CoA dehydrogenase family protein [Nesterenkonia sp.]
MSVQAVLSSELLETIRQRADGYDERNEFCYQDLEDLKTAGYLAALVPAEQGGLGWSFDQVVEAQRLLASYASATALAVNMHHVWVTAARLMVRSGHDEFQQVITETAEGHIFAFGISEAGNDAVLFDSTTDAEVHPDGSVSFTGTKVFTTLAPVWTRLGLFGKDTAATGAEGEKPLIFGFLEREAPGWSTIENWDMLGMRATQSHATALEGARVPAQRIVRRLPVGPNPDPLVFAIFASFLTLLAAVYTGLGDRALALGAEHAASRRSLNTGASLDQDPDIRYKLAEAQLQQLALDAQLRCVAAEVESGVEHGAAWFPRLVTLRTCATRTARAVLDAALGVSGGAQYHRTTELSRLYRDALAGIHHPSDDESAHRTLANHLLGPLA